MTANLKGEIAELKVQLRAAEKGVLVSKPTTASRYDLVLDEDGKMKRVQVKYSDQKPSCSDGAIRVMFEKKSQSKSAKTRRYTSFEIDCVMVYVPGLDKVLCFNREHFHMKSGLNVRIIPAKNGQKMGIIWWEDFVW